MDASSKIVTDTDGASAKRPRGRPRSNLTLEERSRKNSQTYRNSKSQLVSAIQKTLLTGINAAIVVLKEESCSNEAARKEALNILEYYKEQWDLDMLSNSISTRVRARKNSHLDMG